MEESMKLKNLDDLFVDGLQDVYDAEKRITKALPKMAKAATSPELKEAFQEHLKATEQHIERLDRIFEEIDQSPGRKPCEAMVGLLKEGDEFLDGDYADAVRDAGLIAAAQKVEHYEMATYGCLRDWAGLLGNTEASEQLQETLDEEGDADKRLTSIAQALNVAAMEEDEDSEAETRPRPARSAKRASSR
jgi:ferritin-like metal-binding protein YciE